MHLRSSLLLALLLGAGHLSADILYSVTDLGNPGAAINDAGQATGASNGHAFLYSNGQMSDLGTLPGDFSISSFANAINDAGQVVGSSVTSLGNPHAFLYSNGQMRDLGTLGGDFSSAYSINNAGQVVG